MIIAKIIVLIILCITVMTFSLSGLCWFGNFERLAKILGKISLILMAVFITSGIVLVIIDLITKMLNVGV